MTSQRKTLLIAAFFVLTFVALSLGLAFPLIGEIRNHSQNIAELRKELVFLNQKNQEISDFQKTYPALKTQLDKINQVFVDPEVPLSLVQFFEEQARKSDLSLNISLSSRRDQAETLFPFLSFQLSLRGRFADILKFLEKMETAPYLIEVEDVNVKRMDEKQSVEEKLAIGDGVASLRLKVFTPLELKE